MSPRPCLRLAATLVSRRTSSSGIAGQSALHPRRWNVSDIKSAARRSESSAASPAKPAEQSAAPPHTTSATAKPEPASSSSDVPIPQTVGAMIVGVATVSLFAYGVETATSSSVPDFDPTKERFDQTNFSGRFCKMLLGCDPSLVTYTEASAREHGDRVRNYQAILAEAGGSASKEVHRSLWESLRISSSALHPDTGDTIPRPFRMSGYVPYNGPICVAMVASQSTPALLFWSWVNQSQNALINYFNRNASSEMSNEVLAKSYGAAVGSALIVAFGLATFIQKKYPPAQAKNLLRWVAFPSAVVASSLNCYIVRSPEMTTGVRLVDKDGKDVLPGETSLEAAKRGVHSTTASRALLQAPVYFLPPVLMSAIPVFKNALIRHPAWRVPMTTYLLLVSFGIGLPATVAIFPQMSEIKVDEAEEKYRDLKEETTGKPYEVLYYNKGL